MPIWSDRFLHDALRADPQVLSRARLTVQLTTVLIAAAVAYVVFYTAVVPFRAGAIILTVGACAGGAVLALLRAWPRLPVAGHALTFVVFAALVALMGFEGGVASLITPWLITPPIFAILLLGRRQAVAWTALCVLTIVAFHVAESRGARFPIGYPAEWSARITLGSHAGLVICTAVLLFVFEQIRATAQARAETASAALARLAYHDALTGLANRTRFLECLDLALARAHAAGDASRVGVLLVDLDGFKAVNDSLGHAAGDVVLTEVATRLLNATRGCDTVARLGGDEFAVLVDGVREDADVSVVAERIVAAIAAPLTIDGQMARVGASVGIARAADAPGGRAPTARAVGAATPERGRVPRGAAAAILHDADLAMYRAKALGRGRWERLEPEAPRAPALAG